MIYFKILIWYITKFVGIISISIGIITLPTEYGVMFLFFGVVLIKHKIKFFEYE